MKPPKKDKDGNYPVRLVLAVEGVETSDGRTIAPEALGHRSLPLSIMGLTKTTGEGGHAGAEICGRLDTAERVPGQDVRRLSAGDGSGFPEGTFVWRGTGVLFPDSPATDRFLQGGLRGNSVDLTAAEAEMAPSTEDSDELAAPPKPGEARKMPKPPKVTFTKATIAATTLCPVPAFEDAYIEADFGDGWQPVSEAVEEKDAALVASLVAAGQVLPSFRAPSLGDFCAPCAEDEDGDPEGGIVAAAPPVIEGAPDADWFTDPQLTRLTRLTVLDSGEVVGHIAGWRTCHTSYTDRCVRPPRSRTDYAVFLGGSIRAQSHGNPKRMGVGQLTLGGGHADRRLGLTAAVEHYDNVGTSVADIACGEDKFGIWVHGALRPGVTSEQLRALEGSKPSGDWRRFDGFPELMAVHCVNVAGFPVMAAYHDGDGYQSLVAAGALEEGVSVLQAEPDERGTDVDLDALVVRLAEHLGLDTGKKRAPFEKHGGDSKTKQCSEQGCTNQATKIVLAKGDEATPQHACDNHAEGMKNRAGEGAVAKTLADDLTYAIELSPPQKPASVWHAPHDGQKCSRWASQHDDDTQPAAAACREEGGTHLGACAAHKREMTEGQEMADQDLDDPNADDGPDLTMGDEWQAFLAAEHAEEDPVDTDALARRRDSVLLAERRRAVLSPDPEAEDNRFALAMAEVALDLWFELADTDWPSFLDQLDALSVADRELFASDEDFNWVSDVGGLPPLIKRVSKHLQAKGMDQSRAIATAVNVVKKYCSSQDLNFPGKQNIKAETIAKGCAAVSEWEAKKARARAT